MIELAFLGDDSSEALKNGFLTQDPNGETDLGVQLRVGSPLCSFVGTGSDGASDPFFAALEPREPSLLTLGEPNEFKPPTPPKRRRNELTCAERIQLIQEYITSGESVSQQSLANKYGVSRSCVNRLLKIRDVIMQQSNDLGPADRKRFKKATYSEIEHLLLAWIAAVRERNERVNGPMIQAKGLAFARELSIESFTASSGWLERFLKRNNLHLFELNGGQGAHRSTRHSFVSQVPPSFAPTDHESVLFSATSHPHSTAAAATTSHNGHFSSADPAAAAASCGGIGPLASLTFSGSATVSSATSPSAHPLDRTAAIASEDEWLSFLRAELAAYAPRDRFNLDECTLLLPPALTKHQQTGAGAHSASAMSGTGSGPANGAGGQDYVRRSTLASASSRQTSSSSPNASASTLPKRTRTKKFLLPTQDRLVVSLCFNQQGDRERPLLVSRFPLAGDDAAAAAPDVHYVCHPAALLTSRIFENWLLQFERRLAAEGRCVALVLDRIAPHAGLSQSVLQRLHHIRLLFLPPALSPTTQPFQRGIVISFKQKYRQAMEATLGTCKLGIIPARSSNKRFSGDPNNASHFGVASNLLPAAPAPVSAGAHQQQGPSIYLHASGSPGPLAFVQDPALNPFVDAFQFGVGVGAHVHQLQAHAAESHMGLDLLDDPLALPHSHSYSTLNPVSAISTSSYAKRRGAALDHSSNRTLSSFEHDDEHDQRVVTIVDAIRWVSEAWRRLPVAAIAKGFSLAHYDVDYMEPGAVAVASQQQQTTAVLTQIGGGAMHQVPMAFAPSAVGLRATTGFPGLIIPPGPHASSLVTVLPTTPAPQAQTLALNGTSISEAPSAAFSIHTLPSLHQSVSRSAPYAAVSSVASASVAQQPPSQPSQQQPEAYADEEYEQPDDTGSCVTTNPVESASVLQMSVAEVIKDQLTRSKDLKQTFGWSGFGRRSAPASSAISQLKLKSKKPLPKRKPNKRTSSLRTRPQLPAMERQMSHNLNSIDSYTPSVSDALHCVRVLDLFARSRAPALLAQVRSLETSLGQLLDAAFPASSGPPGAAATGPGTTASASDLSTQSGAALGAGSASAASATASSSSSRGVVSGARGSGSRTRSRPARKTRPRSLKARTASVTDDSLAVEFDDTACQGAATASGESATVTASESQTPQLDEEAVESAAAPFIEGSNDDIDDERAAQEELNMT